MSTDDGDRKVDEFVEPRSSGEERDSFRLDDERLDAFGEPQIKYTGGHWTPNER
ncbi:MAG: hypothetical protein GWO05_23160, partial [Gammaproteobacteria bacterium]|nr:hypothetical protein [Gammaproteobacteria bacterium]